MEIPNIGPLRKTKSLIEEYRYNKTLTQRYGMIAQKYPYFQAARGDGNCYYRSVIFSFFVQVCLSENDDILTPFLDNIDNQEYMEKQLNDLMKNYKSNQVQRDLFYSSQVEEHKRNAAEALAKKREEVEKSKEVMTEMD